MAGIQNWNEGDKRDITEEELKTLTEGDVVEFDVVEGPKGLQASKVNKVR